MTESNGLTSILERLMRLLKSSDLANVRKQYTAKQKYLCALCDATLAGGVPMLDHCHKTGHVRSTLCRSCNEGEGMLIRTPITNLAKKDPAKWLRRLADYWEYHAENPSGLIHPTFDVKTGKQKPVKRRKK